MKKRVKNILIVFLILAVSTGAVYAFTRPVEVETVTVSAGEMETWFTEEGKVSDIDDYQIFSDVSGKITGVYVEKGDYVEAGTVIAQVDTVDYMAEIQIRNSNISTYLAQQRSEEENLSILQLQTELGYAEEQLNTYKSLYEEGAVSKEVYEAYEKTHSTMLQRVKQADALKESTSQVYAAMIESERNAIVILENSIKDCTITAGKSGYITELPAANMSSVYPQALLCTIKDEKNITVESWVSTENIGHAAVGDEVELIQKTREEDFVYKGRITDIENWADETVSALGVIEHRVKVVIRPEEEMPAVSSGYNIDVKFFTFKGESAMALPSSAFYKVGGQDYVLSVRETQTGSGTGTVEAIAVEKGTGSNSQFIVLSGVEEGNIIIKNASLTDVSEGTKVKYKNTGF